MRMPSEQRKAMFAKLKAGQFAVLNKYIPVKIVRLEGSNAHVRVQNSNQVTIVPKSALTVTSSVSAEEKHPVVKKAMHRGRSRT